MRSISFQIRIVIFELCLLWVTPCALADMIIDSTRIIYPAGRREIAFRVSNVSKEKPALIQMWVDDGVNTGSPEEVVTPFNVSPPIARVDPNGSQVVRMVFIEEPMPKDLESLYWFNMLEVPQKSSAENSLSFAIRTRIKLFFRPKGLAGDPAKDMSKVTWRVVKTPEGWAIEGHNPSPFHMSFLGLYMGEPGKYTPITDGGMLLPMGQARFTVMSKDEKLLQKHSTLVADFINDFGGINSTSFALPSPAK
jgi:chaperone protein EcpD